MSNKAQTDELDLAEYIIEGIPDEILWDQGRMQRFMTKEQLLSAFEKISLNRKSFLHYKNKQASRDVIGVTSMQKFENEVNKPGIDTRLNENEKKWCFNCGTYGHTSLGCTKEK